jgi:hypothetical protein
MARRGKKPGSRKTGGRKRGTPNRITIRMGGTFAETTKQFDGEALATLVEVMRDKSASPSARVRAAELVLDRAHGKAAPILEQPRDPDFVPLAERLKWYARRDAIEAAEGKVVQILPPKTVRPVELPSDAMPRATTVEDDPSGGEPWWK